MRSLFILLFLLMFGCAEPHTRTDHELTSAQSERKMEIIHENDLLNHPELLIGTQLTDLKELLGLANRTAKKGNELWYVFDVPRADRAADFNGPWDEGDGSLSIYAVDGVISEARYTVAEF